MDPEAYVSPRVEDLTKRADEVYDVAPGVSNSFSTWSALKLILHSASINMYTTVMSHQPIQDTYYIDALAGSGVSEYEDGEYFLGSALIACRAAKEPFSKMYFIEGDSDRCEALRQRLEYVFELSGFTRPSNYEVIHGDANEEIPEVTQNIYERSSFDDGFNYFTFIDNQGMDVEWDAIEELTPTPQGDLLVNLPIAQAVGRNVGTGAANRFYGTDTGSYTKLDSTRKQLRELYQRRLGGQGREVQTSTKVQADPGSYYYDLIYATRKIEGGNDYMEVIEYVKDMVEDMHSGNVDVILDVIRGNQSQLKQYLPDEAPEGNELMEEATESDTDQSSLSDY
ncbi:hypothetical protein BRD20_10175 [Halobacteriales archaeon SW_8_65_20]|nr:MAG: hypothetical protein BRD20_10175 [Halobacteriales archaeon SW_8_65_20]